MTVRPFQACSPGCLRVVATPSLVELSTEALAEHSRGILESFKKRVVMFHQIHTYTELWQKIHNDLRLQHPEWVQPNGESPICDSYDARLMVLLDALTRTNAKRVQELPTTYQAHHLPARQSKQEH
jgi:hypothetical protein